MLDTLIDRIQDQETSYQNRGFCSANRELLCGLEAETQILRDVTIDEETFAANNECITRAVSFLRMLDAFAENETVLWSPFEVNTATDGGVEFYRFASNGQISLTFRPCETRIDLQIKEKGQSASRRWIDSQEAVNLALDTLRAA